MIRLWRVCPWDRSAAMAARGHPLWVPRALQGAGRHDNPHLYGALYLSESATAAVAETIAHLRGQAIEDADFEREGIRLALVSLDAAVDGRLWDLDDPTVLVERSLRPSQVATGSRETTQAWSATLFRARPRRDGIRWWSVLESSWTHVTMFDRALPKVALAGVPEQLRVDHPVVRDAAHAIGAHLP